MDSVSKLSRKLACWCALYKVFTLWQLLFMLTIPQLVNGKENLALIDGKCLLYPRFLADVRCALVHPFCITWLREQCLAWSIQTATSPSRIENAYQNSIILGHCDFPVVTRWYILMKYYCFFFSRDCPIFYMRKKVQKDLSDQDKLIQRFGDFTWWSHNKQMRNDYTWLNRDGIQVWIT